ncbi:MAG: MotA/TolQ/ExbB proton channel family protein [candidate division WOR-3 bacterium]|nr:MAG: MotA/TolQ/ExbB proton channel family protein [candidate division WOR-3 bacterium]
MNILRIFLESSIAAQIIMAILVIFSVWSWGIFLKKLFDFAKVRRKSSTFFSKFRFQTGVKDLESLGEQLQDNPYGRILGSGLEEFKKLSLTKQMFSGKQNYQKGSNEWMSELSDNIRLAMERAKITEIRNLESALPTLSTFVSVSPFLGLLGTVWGIMVAFLEIRARGSAHITIVAPGISDALITTVYGLLVAIPALIFHNIFRSRVNNFDAEMDKFMSEVFARLRKDLTLT